MKLKHFKLTLFFFYPDTLLNLKDGMYFCLIRIILMWNFPTKQNQHISMSLNTFILHLYMVSSCITALEEGFTEYKIHLHFPPTGHKK